MGVEAVEPKKLLARSLRLIIEFIQITSENSRHPKLDYVKEV